MGTLKQRISFIILITFFAFSCKDKPVAITSAKDVTITLEVKAKELFNLPNPNKVTIDQKCSLSDGVASSGYNGSHVSFTTEVYNTKFVYWESKLNPDPVNNGYLVEIIYIVRNGSPVILDKNVITKNNGNGELKAKVTKDKYDNEYIINFIITSPGGVTKSFVIDPILKANP